MYTLIKAKFLEARKARNQVAINLLSTLCGEIETAAKNKQIDFGNVAAMNELTIQFVNKFLKSNKETLQLVKKEDQLATLTYEKEILESFLPTQLTESELSDVIQNIASQYDANNKVFIGQVMKDLKSQYPNQFDNMLASILIAKYKQ